MYSPIILPLKEAQNTVNQFKHILKEMVGNYDSQNSVPILRR